VMQTAESRGAGIALREPLRMGLRTKGKEGASFSCHRSVRPSAVRASGGVWPPRAVNRRARTGTQSRLDAVARMGAATDPRDSCRRGRQRDRKKQPRAEDGGQDVDNILGRCHAAEQDTPRSRARLRQGRAPRSPRRTPVASHCRRRCRRGRTPARRAGPRCPGCAIPAFRRDDVDSGRPPDCPGSAGAARSGGRTQLAGNETR